MAKHGSFMPKYGNFENQKLSRKLLPIEHKYAQFRRPVIESEFVSLLLELWPMAELVVKQSAKAHGPLVGFFKVLNFNFFFFFAFVNMGPYWSENFKMLLPH